MKLPRFIEVVAYLLLSLFLTISNGMLILYSCGGIENPNCHIYQLTFHIVLLLIIESAIIAFLTTRKLPSLLGTSIFPLWVLLLAYLTISRGFHSLDLGSAFGSLILISVLSTVSFIASLAGISLRRFVKRIIKQQ